MPRVTAAGEFLGDAPPEKVLEVMQKLSKSPVPRAVLNKSHLRNAAACAIMLGLASTRDGIVYRSKDTKDLEASLIGSVTNTRSFKIVSELLRKSPNTLATEIGKALSEHFDLPWSEATNLRRGNALRKWARWAKSQTAKQSEP